MDDWTFNLDHGLQNTCYLYGSSWLRTSQSHFALIDP